ncbi:hypothetical protein BIW11_04224 [Tropilaelaps mercedesae]|uniref:Uncharacterized protein n=1 Tax=Tropilaelaps mercedesae TaxID=418985 RepID=A0A1V9X9K6_9ACAR|nr:hypothetical protein BIW11_04224 [Tropilaelaps mercedesae]
MSSLGHIGGPAGALSFLTGDPFSLSGLYGNYSGQKIQLPVNIWVEDAAATSAISSTVKIEPVEVGRLSQSDQPLDEAVGADLVDSVNPTLWAATTATTLSASHWPTASSTVISAVSRGATDHPRGSGVPVDHRQKPKCNRRTPSASRQASGRRDTIASNDSTLLEPQPAAILPTASPSTTPRPQRSAPLFLRPVRVQRVGAARPSTPRPHHPPTAGASASASAVDLARSATITVIPTNVVTIQGGGHIPTDTGSSTGRQIQLGQTLMAEAVDEFNVDPDSEEIRSLRTAPDYFLVDSGRVSPRQLSSPSPAFEYDRLQADDIAIDKQPLAGAAARAATTQTDHDLVEGGQKRTPGRPPNEVNSWDFERDFVDELYSDL